MTNLKKKLSRIFRKPHHAHQAQKLSVKKISKADRRVFDCPPTMSPEECTREVLKRAKIAVISDISKLPQFKEILTAPQNAIEIPASYQSRMAILHLGNQEVWAVGIEDAFVSGYFRSLISRAEDLGFTVVKKAKITVACLAELNNLFLANHSTTDNEESEQDYEHNKSQAAYLFEEIIHAALESFASDIHICVRFSGHNPTGSVLFRIHGLLHKHATHAAGQLKTMLGVAYSNTQITDKTSRSRGSFNIRENQSCTMRMNLHNSGNVDHELIELRYQHLAVRDGFDAIIRLLRTGDDSETQSLESLGYSASQEHMLSMAARKTTGAIFISGVTGSGKTTTLKTLLTMNHNKNAKKKTYTIEDPPEYKLFGTSQISVQRNNDKSAISPFAAAMKDVMRADPDRIMVGEVRDRESASMLQTMVQSGHQVLASVHTSSALGIISRLTSHEIGLDIQTLTADRFLSLLVYQRLLPVSCPSCKIPGAEVLPEYIIEFLEETGIDINGVFARNKKGCPECQHRGTIGQTVCAEIVELDPTILRLLRDGKDMDAVDYWRNQRVSSFNQADSVGKTAMEHALFKVGEGLIDPQDVEEAFEPFEQYKIVKVCLPPQNIERAAVISLKNTKAGC